MNNTGGRKKGIRNFSLRMPDETLEKLHYVSSYFGRSANGQLLCLLREYFEKFEKRFGSISFENKDW